LIGLTKYQTDLHTPNAGKRGVSGGISFGTGIATEGMGGKIDIRTGTSMEGEGGEINLLAGTSSSRGYRSSYDGSAITLLAGDTTARGGVGGAVQIAAGRGYHADRRDGGQGGNVEIVGGAGYGLNKETSVGELQLLISQMNRLLSDIFSHTFFVIVIYRGRCRFVWR